MRSRDPLWWFGLARCRGRMHVFISPGPNTEMCRRICDTCDALDLCFWYAVSREELSPETRSLRYGIFGGLNARERAEYVAKYSITADQAVAEYHHQEEILRIRLIDETRLGSDVDEGR